MTTTLPENMSFGYVKGRFLLAVADGTDPERFPDGIPAQGKVTFTPSAAWLLDVAAAPDPVTVLPRTVECTLDSDGYLVDPQGTRGVYLVATDDPDLNPTGWTYTVTVTISGYATRSFSIAVPASSEQDLTTLSPVASATGVANVRGPKGDQGDQGDEGPPGPPGEVTEAELDAAIAAHEAAPDPHPQYVLDSEKGAASGVATLDSGGKVPDSQIPSAIARDSEVTAAIAAQAAVDSATYATPATTLAASRIETARGRVSLAARAAYDVARSIGNARLARDLATSTTEAWANLTAWAGTGVQVSGGKAFPDATGIANGINRSFRVAPGETARIVVKLNFVASPNSGVLIGFNDNTSGAAPAAGGAQTKGLFFKTGNVVVPLTDGSQGSTLFTGLGNSTWTITFTVDENYISAFASCVGGGDPRIYYRWTRDDSTFPINNFTIMMNDNRALSGCSIEAITEMRRTPSGAVGLPTGDTLTSGVTGHWGSLSGDNFLILLPDGYDSRRPTRAAICFHGNGTDETFWTTNANAKAVADAFLANGYIVIAAANTGTVSTWGAQAGIDAYHRAYRYARDHYNIGTVVTFGNSMGNIEALNVLMQDGVPGVAAHMCTVPTYDLAENRANALFTSTIDAAYGGWPGASAGHDPATADPILFRGVPTWVLYATDDASVTPTPNAVEFINDLAAIGVVATVVTATGGHSTAAVATNAAAMVSWCNNILGLTGAYPA